MAYLLASVEVTELGVFRSCQAKETIQESEEAAICGCLLFNRVLRVIVLPDEPDGDALAWWVPVSRSPFAVASHSTLSS